MSAPAPIPDMSMRSSRTPLSARKRHLRPLAMIARIFHSAETASLKGGCNGPLRRGNLEGRFVLYLE